MTDRDLLTNVPIEASNKNDKMKIYRHHQFLHMLRNYSEILDATPIVIQKEGEKFTL